MFIVLNLNICYSAESLVDKLEKMEKEIKKDQLREKELSYLFTITNACFKEQKKQYTYPGIQGFLMSFPFLNFSDNDQLESVLYGAKKFIEYKEILRWIEDFFFREEKKGFLRETMKIIEIICKEIAKIRIITEKKAKENDIETPNWEDILLSVPFVISKINEFKDLFKARDQIIEEMKISFIDVFVKNDQLSKKSSLLTEIWKLTEKMKDYHKSEQKNNIILIPKKETSEEFKELICHRKKIAESILAEEKEERKRYMNAIPRKIAKSILAQEEEKQKIEGFYKQKDKNTEYIQNKLLNIQSITKLFLIIYKLSQYFEAMNYEEFIGSLEKLNSKQLVGLSSIILLTDIFNNCLYENTNKNSYEYTLELTHERYFFNKIKIGRMQNTESNYSESKVVKEILNCVGEMKEEIEKINSGAIYSKMREDFLRIFESSKKENNQELELVKSNIEEQKSNK